MTPKSDGRVPENVPILVRINKINIMQTRMIKTFICIGMSHNILITKPEPKPRFQLTMLKATPDLPRIIYDEYLFIKLSSIINV